MPTVGGGDQGARGHVSAALSGEGQNKMTLSPPNI